MQSDMKFYSTSKSSSPVSFKEAVVSSLPKDGGLYFPTSIPTFPSSFLREISSMKLWEIGFQIMRPYCEGDIPSDTLQSILEDTFCFDIPLNNVHDQIHSLELFHGPTFAFKDVGARFLARCLAYFQKDENQEVTILVATSGDTGGAVATGFHNIPGVRVVVLYPTGKVSDLQERQMTTLGGNITALEVSGDFDDCQRMVKEAFLDRSINDKIKLSSANSINIARWLPQSIYYFVPFQQPEMLGRKIAVCVPSGNYGNITAGLLAKKSGLPIHRFIAASNANDIVPRYLKSGSYEPKPTVATISNAMDVSLPSNYVRLQELCGEEYQNIIKEVSGGAMHDAENKETMKHVYQQHDYLMDPHSAIGYGILSEEVQQDEIGVYLSTAHYCKFKDVVESAIGESITIPSFADTLFEKEKKSFAIGNSLEELKDFLLHR